MELKKNQNADLTRKTGLYLNIGFVISLLLVILIYQISKNELLEVIQESVVLQDELLSEKKVRKMLGVSTSTMQRYRENPENPLIFKGGYREKKHITRSELLEWQKNRL